MPKKIPAKCDPRFGWEKGRNGKCIRSKVKDRQTIAAGAAFAGAGLLAGAALLRSGGGMKYLPSLVPKSESDDLRFTGKKPPQGMTSAASFVRNSAGKEFFFKEMNIPLLWVQGSMEVAVSDMANQVGAPVPPTRLIPAGHARQLTKYPFGGTLSEVVEGKTVRQLQGTGEESPNFQMRRLGRSTLDTIKRHDDLAKIAAIDAFTGNWDRGNNNVMKNPVTGRYYGIDNGNGFSSKINVNARSGIEFLSKSKPSDFDDDDIKALRTYRDTLRAVHDNNPPEVTEKRVLGYLDQEGASIHWRRPLYTQNIRASYQDSAKLLAALDRVLSQPRADAKCDPRFGWEKGARGKCVRRKPGTSAIAKGTAVGGVALAGTTAAAYIAFRGGEGTKNLPSLVPKSESDALRFTGKRPSQGATSLAAFVRNPAGKEFFFKEAKFPLRWVQGSVEVTVGDMAQFSGILAPKTRMIPAGHARHLTQHPYGGVLSEVVNGKTVEDLQREGAEDQGFRLKTGYSFGGTGFDRRVLRTMTKHEDLARIVALDTFTGNWDRSAANVMKDEGGRYHAIDNANGFSSPFNQSAKGAVEYFKGQRREDFDEAEIRALTTYRDTLKKLQFNNPPELTEKRILGYLNKEGANFHYRRSNYKRNVYTYYQDSARVVAELDRILGTRGDTLRLDRKMPAKCSKEHGWTKGVRGKCVRVKGRNGNSPKINAAKVGLALAGAGTIGLAVSAAHIVSRDLKKSSVPFDSIRQPPGGIPDAQTLAKYDTFQPGDLIRKNFKSSTMGSRQHYAVYLGKDPETGDHMCIDSGENWKDRDNVPAILKRGLTWVGENPENDSEWEKVPPKDMGLDPDVQKFSREQIVKRAELMLYSPFEYRGFRSNCESFARGIVEGKAYSIQGMQNSPLTNFIAETVTHNALKLRTRPPLNGPKEAAFNTNKEKTRFSLPNIGISGEKLKTLEVTGLSNYATNQDKMTAQQVVTFLRQYDVAEKSRENWDWIENPYSKQIDNKYTRRLQRVGMKVPNNRPEIELVLQGKEYRRRKEAYDRAMERRSRRRKDAIADDYLGDLIDSEGIKDPDFYWEELNQRLAPIASGSLHREALIQGVQAYLEVFFGLFHVPPKDPASDRSDSLRLDRRLPAKCDPRYGWRRGPEGKCVRVKAPSAVPSGSGRALAASVNDYETNPATGQPYKIRELREVAREKGIVGYGSMSTSQMRDAMRLVDNNPEEAQQQNIVKTMSKDRSIANRSVTAGFGSLAGKSVAERKAIRGARDAAKTWKRLEALMRFSNTAPAKWGAAAAAAFLLGTTIQGWERLKSRYREGLAESTKMAQERALLINTRPPTALNPKGQVLPWRGQKNITFAVGAGRNYGAEGIIDLLKQPGKQSNAGLADQWLSKHYFIPFNLRENGVGAAGAKETPRAIAEQTIEQIGNALRNTMRRRNQDAVDLAANLFAYASQYPDKKINVVAHSAGGMATKEALEIVSRMSLSRRNKKTITGKQVLSQINVVLVGTPHFGYTENVSKNMRTIWSAQDPLSVLPSFGDGARTQWISSVKDHKIQSYLQDSYVRESIHEAFGYFRGDSEVCEKGWTGTKGNCRRLPKRLRIKTKKKAGRLNPRTPLTNALRKYAVALEKAAIDMEYKTKLAGSRKGLGPISAAIAQADRAIEATSESGKQKADQFISKLRKGQGRLQAGLSAINRKSR